MRGMVISVFVVSDKSCCVLRVPFGVICEVGDSPMWEKRRNTLYGSELNQIERHYLILPNFHRFTSNNFKPITHFGMMGVGDDGGEPV